MSDLASNILIGWWVGEGMRFNSETVREDQLVHHGTCVTYFFSFQIPNFASPLPQPLYRLHLSVCGSHLVLGILLNFNIWHCRCQCTAVVGLVNRLAVRCDFERVKPLCRQALMSPRCLQL